MNASRLSHEGRVAIVAGSARGIGQAIALKLTNRGALLVLVDLEKSHDTAHKIGGDSLIVVADVSSAADGAASIRWSSNASGERTSW